MVALRELGAFLAGRVGRALAAIAGHELLALRVHIAITNYKRPLKHNVTLQQKSAQIV